MRRSAFLSACAFGFAKGASACARVSALLVLCFELCEGVTEHACAQDCLLSADFSFWKGRARRRSTAGGHPDASCRAVAPPVAGLRRLRRVFAGGEKKSPDPGGADAGPKGVLCRLAAGDQRNAVRRFRAACSGSGAEHSSETTARLCAPAATTSAALRA